MTAALRALPFQISALLPDCCRKGEQYVLFTATANPDPNVTP